MSHLDDTKCSAILWSEHPIPHQSWPSKTWSSYSIKSAEQFMMALGEILISSGFFFPLLFFLLWEQLPGLYSHSVTGTPEKQQAEEEPVYFIYWCCKPCPAALLVLVSTTARTAAVSTLQCLRQCDEAAAAHRASVIKEKCDSTDSLTLYLGKHTFAKKYAHRPAIVYTHICLHAYI